jgi:hypothetical protein
VSRGQVIGGVVLGLLLTFLANVALFVVLYSMAGENPWLNAVPFLLPAIGVVVLLVPRWRRTGAGLLMGLAIGSIVFAGVCAAFLASTGQMGA